MSNEIDTLFKVLSENEKVTAVGLADFGYAYADHLIIKEVKIAPYAQYERAIHVVFRMPRQRLDRSLEWYANDKYSKLPVILAGHQAVDRQKKMIKVSETRDAIVTRTAYRSFDSRNVTDIIEPFEDLILFRPARY